MTKILLCMSLIMTATIGVAEDPVEKEFNYVTSHDKLHPMYAMAVYPSEQTNLPVIVIMHGYAGSRHDVMFTARRLAEKGFFCICPDTRGWGGSAGDYDNGGWEIMDIFDCLDTAIAQYKKFIDSNRVSIMGYSNGGGQTLLAVVRAPWRFTHAMSLFGAPDYAMLLKLNPSQRPDIERAIGGSPEQQPELYVPRNANLAVRNLNSGTRVHIAYDEEEATCPPELQESMRKAARAAGINNVFYNVSKVGDTYRWVHAHNEQGHLSAIEDVFVEDIRAYPDTRNPFPMEGSLVVPGFLITPYFSCIAGNGDNAAAVIDYTISTDKATFAFSALESTPKKKLQLRLNPDYFGPQGMVSINQRKPKKTAFNDNNPITVRLNAILNITFNHETQEVYSDAEKFKN